MQPRTRIAAFGGVLLAAAACAAAMPRMEPVPPRRHVAPVVRVALAGPSPSSRVSSTGEWRVYDADGTTIVARGDPGASWTVEQTGRAVRAVRADGVPTEARPGPLIARSVDPDAQVMWNGRAYRGELQFLATDSGVLVVNRVPLEDYLRGVVPLEIGNRPTAEHAAVEAQAVAARSYAVAHIGAPDAKPYDLLATVLDQAYGGAAAERAVSDAAVEATSGLVLTYDGRTISAPYHSTCGGSTAEATEVWQHTEGWPYLQRVSDRIPGTDRYYCDPSPRFHWTREFDQTSLAAAVNRYLGAYATMPAGGVGTIRTLAIDGRTASGRVASISVQADRGHFTLRGNEIRFVLRSPAGELLSSTYFSLAAEPGANGALGRLTLRGTGYGHGIGMCQWGAIGRARAGQDFRAILQTYYPGTTLAPIQ